MKANSGKGQSSSLLFSLICIVLLTEIATNHYSALGFVVVPVNHHHHRAIIRPVLLFSTKEVSHPEYSVADEFEKEGNNKVDATNLKEEVSVSLDNEDDNTNEMDVADAPAAAAVAAEEFEPVRNNNNNNNKKKLQYAALEPGTVVQIQVGDITLARKAWKKRRRSGSPLLVPCSVLNVDRQSTVRWNLIYLLEKFGNRSGNSAKGPMIRLTLADLNQRHRTHLKSSLKQHAIALGYETPKDLLQGLFNKKVQETYGVRLVMEEEDDDSDFEDNRKIWLQAPLSRFKAQKRANAAAVLQFCEQENPQNQDTLQHTGVVRNRHHDKPQQQQVNDDNDSDNDDGKSAASKNNIYHLQPLSAALRVTQEDVDSGLVHDGSLHAAVVFDYDSAGDGGAPLLTLSLNPARNQVRDRLKLVQKGSNNDDDVMENPQYKVEELKTGQELNGRVVRFVKGGVLVDCGVGRQNGDSDEFEKVYGTLLFKDAFVPVITGSKNRKNEESNDLDYDDDDDDDDDDEEDDTDWDNILSLEDLDDLDEEEEDDDEERNQKILQSTLDKIDDDEEFADSEDITHLFKQNEDGSLTYTDPESGEVQEISADLDEDELESELQKEGAVEMAPAKGFSSASKSVRKEPKYTTFESGQVRSQRLHQGDRVSVYVKYVSKKHSNQLSLTLDPTVKGKKQKDLKKENTVSKKLTRLADQIGGLHRVEAFRGQECDGTVKAISDAGDWLYVQPNDFDGQSLPVGVASIPEDLSSDGKESFAKGDSVRIVLDGVDENRGQLAMRVLKKLSP